MSAVTLHNARLYTRSCTAASLALCLNQTLVQQSQEEAEWLQSCQPAVETGRQEHVCHWLRKGDPIFGVNMHWHKFHWQHTSSREQGWDWGWVAYSLTKSHSTLQCLLQIETGWMVDRWLCCSSTSTLATSAISAISSVLNGLRIKRVQLFADFAFIGSRIFLRGPAARIQLNSNFVHPN